MSGLTGIASCAGEACTRFCPDLEGDGAVGRREPAGAARMHVEQAREPLGKGASRTGGLRAVEAAHHHLQANATPEGRKVRRAAGIRAVRARGLRCGSSGKTPDRRWREREGRCCAPPRLYTLNYAAGHGIKLLHRASYPCLPQRLLLRHPRKVRESPIPARFTMWM